MKTNTGINCGDRVKDKITGFKGIVVAKTEWLNGCLRISVQPEELHEGKPMEQQTFDVEQLSLIEAGVCVLVQPPTGGPDRKQERAALRRN